MAYTNAVFFQDYTATTGDVARAAVNIASSTWATPIEITTAAPHGLPTGAVVVIAGHLLNTAANGTWKVTWVAATKFSLDTSVGIAVGGASGTETPYGGSSFADAFQTITYATTKSQAGDITHGAKSPAPYSIGQGLWTSAAIPATATKAIQSSTDATPIILTLLAGHGIANGNVVQVVSHTVNTNANGCWIASAVDATHVTLTGSTATGGGAGGLTGTVRDISFKSVVLTTPQTKAICNCDKIWTTLNGGVPAVSTADWKEGVAAAKLTTPNPTAATTNYGYFDIPAGATSFAGYQAISFCIKNEVAVLADQWRLRLYDAAAGGGSLIDEFQIPAIPSTGRWVQMVLPKGGNMGGAIMSVVLASGANAAPPTAAKYIIVDGIVATTVAAGVYGLNLTSLISKNSAEQGGTEAWYGIQSITGPAQSIVVLDESTAATPIVGRGYWSATASETVATYARETTKTAMVTAAATTVQSVGASGSATGGNIQFIGGYDTGTGNCTGETFFDGQNGYGYALYISGRSWATAAHLSFCRCSYGVVPFSSNNITLSLFNVNNNDGGVATNTATRTSLSFANANNNSLYGLNLYASYLTSGAWGSTNNNGTAGVFTGTNLFDVAVSQVSACNNGTTGLYLVGFGPATIGPTAGASVGVLCACNGSQSVYLGAGGGVVLNKPQLDDTVEVNAAAAYSNTTLYAQALDGSADNHWTFSDGLTAFSQVAVRNDASFIAWQMALGTTRTSGYPGRAKIRSLPVKSGGAVTLKLWLKKEHATNSQLQLVVRGGQIAGVAADVTVSCPNDTLWNQVTLPDFTPSEAGAVVVEVVGWYVASGATVNCYWQGPLSAVQA